MGKYRVRWDYEGEDWYQNKFRLRKGEVVELDEEVADWIRAKEPGVLHELVTEEQERLIRAPAQDRMVRGKNVRELGN